MGEDHWRGAGGRREGRPLTARWVKKERIQAGFGFIGRGGDFHGGDSGPQDRSVEIPEDSWASGPFGPSGNSLARKESARVVRSRQK